MIARAAIAAVAVVAIAGTAVGTTVVLDNPTTAAATEIPACTAVTAHGTINDPCNQEALLWQQSNRNALSTMPYYAKWKAANPGEYGKLKAWSTSAASTPDPTLSTAFGVLVRYGITRCRVWAASVSECALP